VRAVWNGVTVSFLKPEQANQTFQNLYFSGMFKENSFLINQAVFNQRRALIVRIGENRFFPIE